MEVKLELSPNFIVCSSLLGALDSLRLITEFFFCHDEAKSSDVLLILCIGTYPADHLIIIDVSVLPGTLILVVSVPDDRNTFLKFICF